MRTLDTTSASAIRWQDSIKFHMLAQVYESRSNFLNYTIDRGPDFAALYPDLPQDSWQVSGSILTVFPFQINSPLRQGCYLCMVISDANNYQILDSFSATFDWHRPGMADGHIFYLDQSMDIVDLDLDINNIHSGAVSSSTVVGAVSLKGSIHAFDQNNFVYIYLDDGGIGVSFYTNDSGWSSITMPGRFMCSGSVLSASDDDDLETLKRTAAVLTSTHLYVYTSTPYGNVLGRKYDLFTGVWSDIFEAISSDLSEFHVTDAFQADSGKIFLLGNLIRDNLEEVSGYRTVNTETTLLCYSEDGQRFAMDRFTGVVRNNLKHYASLNSGNQTISFSNLNRIGIPNQSIYLLGSLPEPIMTFYGTDDKEDIIGFKGSGANGSDSWTLEIGDSDDSNLSASLKRGYIVIIQIGVDGNNWNQFGRFVITNIRRGFADGERSVVLGLTSESLWKLQSMTYPFYMEIQGRQCNYDPLDNLDNLYPANNVPKEASDLIVDFWSSENNKGNGFGPITIATSGSHTANIMTGDLKDYGFTNYPVVKSIPLSVSIYGWSRTEVDDPGIADAFDSIIQAEDLSGSIHNIVTSGSNPPVTYFTPYEGEYPVVISVTTPNIEVGWKIIEMGVVVTSASPSQFYLERIVVSGATCYTENSNVPWEKIETTDIGNDVAVFVGGGTPGGHVVEIDSAQGKYRLPGAIVPYIMFAETPYTSFNFTVEAAFNVTSASSWGGVVGLAQDGSNYVGARMNSGSAQIFKVRDGDETVLATTGSAIGINILVFKNRDGVLSISVRDYVTGISGSPILEYRWTEADGPMMIGDDDPMKVGVYGQITAPHFKICTFDLKDSIGIGVLPNQPWTLDQFPTSGSIKIGDASYSYVDRMLGSTYIEGPFQYRTWSIREEYEGDDEIMYSGSCLEYTRLNWADNSLVHSEYNDYLISISGGHVWKVVDTDFKPFSMQGGSPVYLRNRVRVFCNEANDSAHSTANKVWIGPGLLTSGSSEDAEDSLLHGEGEICYLDNGDSVELVHFAAFNENHDTTIADLIQQICATSGAIADFPGDIEVDEIVLYSGGDEYVVV